MKNERVTIAVTYNGYVVESQSRDDCGRWHSHQGTWTFESLKKLQERLPEILDIPFEKRDPKATK